MEHESLPTFKECMDLVYKKPDVFMWKKEEVDGYTFHIFNYRLANYEDFDCPAAYEMRGLTFLEGYDRKDADNFSFKPFIHLHKFFNVGQGGQSESEKYKGKIITRVQNKEDGSLIIPIKVLSKIYFKTRGTFFSEQAKMAHAVYANNKGLVLFINICYSQGQMPIFELVSPWNQIVLRYQKTELRLLQLRDLKTGRYIAFDEYTVKAWKINFGVETTKLHSLTDIERLTKNKTEEEIKSALNGYQFKGLNDLLSHLEIIFS